MASQESSTPATSSLINDVKQLVKNFHEQKERVSMEHEQLIEEHDAKISENRKKGCDELYEHIKSLIPEKVKTYATYGRNEARVFEFKFKDEVKFGNCFAKDLLIKGDVIPRLQAYLDVEHADEKGSAFFVYFTHIGRYQTDHSENKFGVFVNWDKESWGLIKERIAAKPFPISERKTKYEENAPHTYTGSRSHERDGLGGHGCGRGIGRGRGFGRGRGRGTSRGIGRGNGPVGMGHGTIKVTIKEASPGQNGDLPEKHDE